MTSEVEIDGQQYLCTRLPARAQFHIVRRLAPVLKGLAPLFQRMNSGGRLVMSANGDGQMVAVPEPLSVYEAIAALTDTLAMMSDEDADYVIDHCLTAVRFRSGDRWAPLQVQGGGLMLQAAEDLATQLRLVWEVLADNLQNFSIDRLLPSLNGTEQPMYN